jgi:uncharacterized protein
MEQVSKKYPNSLRRLPADFDSQAVLEVDRLLDQIVAEHKVTVPWAIESGSRAWGFPSPDSDYDARFIYVRSIEQYLSPWPPRDVIEMPIEGDMDVNGWDLGKAIKLMLKGNAVVLEWLQSPIIYRGDPQFRDQLLVLAELCADRLSAIRHYYHLGTQQWGRFLASGDEAPAKKLFYSARPALCLRWLRLGRERKVPPMNFQVLLREAEAPWAIVDQLEQLVAAKAHTRELGNAPVASEVRNFIDAEYQLVESELAVKDTPRSAQQTEAANALFFSVVQKYSSSRA